MESVRYILVVLNMGLFIALLGFSLEHVRVMVPMEPPCVPTVVFPNPGFQPSLGGGGNPGLLYDRVQEGRQSAGKEAEGSREVSSREECPETPERFLGWS